MPRKVFEAFTPLDAEDVNTYLMDQAVMSFAGTAARGSAIPAPTDGMASWLQDSDQLEIYNGSSWADPTREPTLVFLGSETFSTVASVSINNVFSADYINYTAILNVTSSTTGDLSATLRVRASGSDLTTETYEVGAYFVGASRPVDAGSINSAPTSSMRIGQTSVAQGGYGTQIRFSNPFTANNTRIFNSGAGGSLDFTAGIVGDTVSYDGFTISVSSSTMSGKISVYGIKES